MTTTPTVVAILLAPFAIHSAIAACPNTIASGIINAHHSSAPYHYSSVDECYSSNNGLVIIKRHEEPKDQEEYVTGFYKRVRDKRRAFFGRQLQQHEEQQQQLHPRGDNKDHSLDHYFDHPLLLSTYRTKGPSSPAPAPSPSLTSSAARSVRGGEVAAISSASADQGESRCSKSETSSYPRARSCNHYSDIDSHRDSQYDDYDDYDSHHSRDVDRQDPDHYLGLLRVPCNIAINQEDARLGDNKPPQTKTPMAAYVDTGAQVTIISASAAKRAGIYHLMDRRYAGRATGVGHCKVLGRIPARHVYFLLGEDHHDNLGSCHDGGYYGNDYRGGGGECCFDNGEQENKSNTVQMDGPALTVLEGTVTQGVDILFGLDVLQDWEACVSLGPTKSITVKKRRNRNNGIVASSRHGSSDCADGDSVMIPFARPKKTHHEERVGGKAAERYPHRLHARSRARSHPSSSTAHSRRHHTPNVAYNANNYSKFGIDVDDEDFLGQSDVESDLDLLDQSGHEFPDEGSHHQPAVGTNTMSDTEDERRPKRETIGEGIEKEEDEYNYFQDAEEIEDFTLDGHEDLDLSGL